jgi:hypothetical protein
MREGWAPREAVREAQSPWVGKPSVDFGDCELGVRPMPAWSENGGSRR